MFSFFRAPIRNTTPQAQVSVIQVYKYITGNYAKLATERLRSIDDPGEARRFKAEMFDYVTFSGCFSTRHNAGLLEHSGFLCFDIDKLESEEQLQNIKAQLITDERLHTVLLFRSPSGNGLKWVVEVPDRVWLRQTESTDNRLQITDMIVKNHRVLYERIRGYLFEQYGIKTDHTSDIARPCYLGYDDDAFYDEPTFHANPAHPFLLMRNEELGVRSDRSLTPNSKMGLYDDTEVLVRAIEKQRIDITSDYHNWIRIAFAIASKHGISGEEYFHRISQFHPSYDPKEAHKVYQSCLRNNSGVVTIATIVYLIHNA